MSARTVWPQALILRTVLPGLRLRLRGAHTSNGSLLVELHKGRWPTSIPVTTQVLHHGDRINPDCA